MQQTLVQSLIQEDPTCRRVADPCATSTEPVLTLQQEKPQQWEAHSLQLESRPRIPQLDKSQCSNEDPAQWKLKIKK